MDTENNPHIVWADLDANDKGLLKYLKGENNGGTVTFPDPALLLANASDSVTLGEIRFPLVDTNKLAKDNDWEDKVFAGWLETTDSTAIKFMRTTPHVTLLLVIDGIDKDYVTNNLGSMPNLQKLFNEYPTIDATALSSLPATTMSAQAEMFTGMKPKTSKVIGDNFVTATGTEFKFLPDNSPDTSAINNFLSSNGVKTLFDYLDDAKRSKAAIPAIYTQGINTARPDFLSQAQVDFSAGSVLNELDRTSYLPTIKNNDAIDTNDGAEVMVAYILTHDHGLNTNPSGISPSQIDVRILDIMDLLKTSRAFNDTIFIITSDHGLRDVTKDDNFSLDNSDLPQLVNPVGVALSDLFLNGMFAFSNDGFSSARVYYANAFNETGSEWYGKIDRIIVKEFGQYNDYSFDGTNDILTPAPDEFLEDMTFSGSPEMILIAKEGYYFQEPHEAIYGQQDFLPFFVTGPGFKLFSRGNNVLPSGIALQDITPTVGFFAGGQEVVDLMEANSIDGKNFYDPELLIVGGSPVNLHLFDSQGRHLGPDAFGNIQLEIPGSEFEVDAETGRKRLSLLQAPDSYTVQIEAFGFGAFDLSISMSNGDQSFTVTYPKTFISPVSIGTVNLSGDLALQLDFDGDGVFENTVTSPRVVRIEQDVANMTATARLIRVPAKTSVALDLNDATGVLMNVNTKKPISNGLITVQKLLNSSLDEPGFFTLGSFVSINISESILNSSREITTAISYPDHVLIPLGVAERSLAIYDRQTMIKLNSTVDLALNRVTAIINRSGEYVLASTGLTPKVSNVTVQPQATNIPNQQVMVSAKITDDGTVASAIVTLLNQTSIMIFNSTTGFFEANVTGPAVSGTHVAVVEATDNDNNSATGQALFVLDLDAPLITILSPQNVSQTTNRINLSYFVNEQSSQSYSVDGGLAVSVNNTAAFTQVNVPLTLASGSHTLAVFASDVFGNNGSRQANFSIDTASVKLTGLSIPLFVKPNQPMQIKATLSNTLIAPLENVAVQLLVDGNVSDVKLFNISSEAGLDTEFSLSKNSGRYNITLHAVPPPGERFTGDNSLSAELLVTDKVPLLLVDDDTSADDSAYRSAIQAAGGLGYDFVPFDVSQRGPPGLDLMSNFPLVAWFAGGEQTLTPLETATLEQYLMNRGYLLLFSNTLGSDAGSTSFYKNFLSAEFRKKGRSKTVEGTFRDQIGRGMLFSILEPGDEIKPLAPATESFRYSGGSSAAIKADNNLFKTAYFTFGLEDVADQQTRNIILNRTLGFFDIDIAPPLISGKIPAANTAFPINTTNLTLSLQTNEVSECRFSETTRQFSLMSRFDSTNSLQHSTQLLNLTNGRNYTILINCKDEFISQNSSESFTFFIHNRTFLPPVLQPIADISESENRTIAIKLNVTDPENDPLSFALSDSEVIGFVPIASRFTFANNTFSLIANFEDAGNYRLRATVFDGFDAVSAEFALTIANVNRPPVLSPIGSKLLLEDAFFSLDVEAQDPDGDDLIFRDNTTLFEISPFNGVIAFTPKGTEVGNHTVNISVSDGSLTDYEVVQLRIASANDAPVITPMPPQTAPEGALFTFQVNAADADNDALTFSDDTALFNISAAGLINFTPANQDVGTHIANITVTDGLANDTKILNLVIEEVNQQPRIISIPEKITVVQNNTLQINVTACDPDADPSCTP